MPVQPDTTSATACASTQTCNERVLALQAASSRPLISPNSVFSAAALARRTAAAAAAVSRSRRRCEPPEMQSDDVERPPSPERDRRRLRQRAARSPTLPDAANLAHQLRLFLPAGLQRRQFLLGRGLVFAAAPRAASAWSAPVWLSRVRIARFVASCSIRRRQSSTAGGTALWPMATRAAAVSSRLTALSGN